MAVGDRAIYDVALSEMGLLQSRVSELSVLATKIVSFPKCTLGRNAEQNFSAQGGVHVYSYIVSALMQLKLNDQI